MEIAYGARAATVFSTEMTLFEITVLQSIEKSVAAFGETETVSASSSAFIRE